MNKHVTSNEVELSAKLTSQEYKSLHKLLSKNFKHKGLDIRFMVRFCREKISVRDPLDIRYKWTNGQNTLVIKKGALGSQQRQETTITLGKNNQLEHFITLFKLLGYKIGNAIYREIDRFENNKVEVALVHAFGEYSMEVESINASSKTEALSHVQEFFTKNNLKSLSKAEYQKYLRYLDRTINLHFSLSSFPDVFKTPDWKKVVSKTVFS